jgi:hypothetical protein
MNPLSERSAGTHTLTREQNFVLGMVTVCSQEYENAAKEKT